MNSKIRDRINGNIWQVIITVLLTFNISVLGFLVTRVNKVYDIAIENKSINIESKTKLDAHEKRLDNIEDIIRND